MNNVNENKGKEIIVDNNYDYIENGIIVMEDDLNQCKKFFGTDSENIEIYTQKTEKLKYVLENTPKIINSVSELSSNIFSGVNGIIQSILDYNRQKLEIESNIAKLFIQINSEIEIKRINYAAIKEQLNNLRETSNRILEHALSIDNINSSDNLFSFKQRLIEISTRLLSEASELIIKKL